MEEIDVKPKLRDIIPLYGCINYVWRTSYDLEENFSVRDQITRGVITLAQVAYNSFVLAEILFLLEGKPTLTSRILEKIVQ